MTTDQQLLLLEIMWAQSKRLTRGDEVMAGKVLPRLLDKLGLKVVVS